jgi:hypothetical protein
MGNTPGDETRNFVTKPSPFDRLIRSFASGMFKRPLNALKLAKLQNERSRVSKDYEAERKRLLASSLSEEEASSKAALTYKGDFRVTHTNVVVFLSDRLIEEAERLRVPVPEDEKYWTRLKYAPHFHLSEEGQAMLRKRVREEKKGRREAVSFWFNIITVILSLLVAILALSK